MCNAFRLEAIASRLEPIASRVEAIATRNKKKKRRPSPNHIDFPSEDLCAIAAGDLHPFGLCELHPLGAVGGVLRAQQRARAERRTLLISDARRP